jgi:hypothetical protein
VSKQENRLYHEQTNLNKIHNKRIQ